MLVVVPHPDDETLLAAGLIRRALSENRRVSVAVVTNGDYRCPDRTKGETRLRETWTAMDRLGLKEEDLYFLGYPDTGYEPEVSFLSALLRTVDPEEQFPSACSTVTYGLPGVKEDYSYLRTETHAPYTRAGFVADLAALLDETDPALVVTTSAWDEHGDHAALSAFVRQALKTRPDVRLWEGIVHSPAGDLSWPIPNAPDAPFSMPPGLEEDTDLRWAARISIPVPADCPKEEIIRLYGTALNEDEPEVVAYLLAFAKQNEIFWAVEDGIGSA